jgi:phytoene/squalene synthetase
VSGEASTNGGAPPAAGPARPDDDRQRAGAPASGEASANGEAPSGADRIPTDGAPHVPPAADPARRDDEPRVLPARTDDAPHVLSASRYLAWLYSPASQQPVFAKLCEIESEIAGSLRPGIDHHVAHARLQWWREECERSAQGRPVHPLTRELVKAYGAVPGGQPSPLVGISGFVDTAVWDLAGATFETRKELTAYCDRWAAAMFETAAGQVAASAAANTGASTATNSGAGVSASGAMNSRVSAAASMAANARANAAASPAARPAANAGAGLAANAAASDASPSVPGTGSRWRVLGAAVREIEMLADLAREAHVGWLRVPLDELERVGVEVKSLAQPPWPAPLVMLMRERHEALRATVGECLGVIGRQEQAEFRGLLVWAALAWKQSARAQRALPNIISPRRYHAFADGWLAWRAARGAAAGNLRLG